LPFDENPFEAARGTEDGQEGYRSVPLLCSKGGEGDSHDRAAMTTIELLQAILMFGVVPLWVAAGVADHACHRVSRIERTSGPKESVLHLLQLVEVGGPLLAALFLEINAGILLFMLLGLLVHQATAAWDVRYANETRDVSPTEQHVHGIMEMLPLMAVVLIAVIHWPAFLSLFGQDVARFELALKNPPLPAWYLASVLAAAVAVGILYVEELVRTLRAAPRHALPPHNQLRAATRRS
jgi:hypothetical protein